MELVTLDPSQFYHVLPLNLSVSQGGPLCLASRSVEIDKRQSYSFAKCEPLIRWT